MRKEMFAWVGAVVAVLAFAVPGSAVANPHNPNSKPTVGIMEPKGLPPVNGQPVAKSLTACSPICYSYVTEQQAFPTGDEAQSMSYSATVSNPFLAQGLPSGNNRLQDDGHTLVQYSAQDANQDMIEGGWTKEQNVCGQLTAPCLFVYSRIAGVGQGYNGGNGWVNAPGCSPCVGASLSSAVGTAKQFGVAHNAGASRWDVSYDGNVVGWYPDSSWSGGFTNIKVVQIFSELASGNLESCSDMGSGAQGGTSPSTVISAYTQTGSSTAASLVGTSSGPGTGWTNPTMWNRSGSGTGFRLGGPGYNEGGWTGAAGTTGSCGGAAQGTPAANSFQFWQEECPDMNGNTGCTNAINFTWSSMTVGTCVPYTLGRPINAVWNNALSSGKTINIYDGGADKSGCDGNSATYGNAFKAIVVGPFAPDSIVAFKRTA